MHCFIHRRGRKLEHVLGKTLNEIFPGTIDEKSPFPTIFQQVTRSSNVMLR